MAASHTVRWLIALVAVSPAARTQPLAAVPPQNLVISTRFLTPLGYEAALSRLGAYYQEQVGRILPLTFPEIAPKRHFEVWHDLFVSFEPETNGMMVTIKRSTDGVGVRLVKNWMLDVAGRLEAPLPLTYKEDPALHKLEADLFTSRRDLAQAFHSDSAMKSIPTWEHAGLLVSASSLTSVVLAPSGMRGVHHVKIEAGTAAEAKALLTRLTREIQKPGIYAVYSEAAELDHEIREMAVAQSGEASATSASAIYIPSTDQKHLEGRVRAEPEMARRAAAAQGQFTIRRVDKAYRKLVITWSELTGYLPASGRFDAERPIGQGVLAGPKPATAAASPVIVRAKLPAIQPGAYRVRVDAEDLEGVTTRVDERLYWFDGKVFEEL